MSKVAWHGGGVLPVFYALALSPKEWASAHRHWGAAVECGFPESGARALHLTQVKGLGVMVLIGVAESEQLVVADSPVRRAALLAHEAVHVTQFVGVWMQEQALGDEVVAYMVQSIMLDLLPEWEHRLSA